MAQDRWKMEEEMGCESPEGPISCANNCGFFGSVSTMNLCSKCYRDLPQKPTPNEASSMPLWTGSEMLKSVTGESNSNSSSGAECPPSKVLSRCFACKKRVGLSAFGCRCGNVFCSLHRYSDRHACPYDYHADARDAIAKANPVIKADKIDKI